MILSLGNDFNSGKKQVRRLLLHVFILVVWLLLNDYGRILGSRPKQVVLDFANSTFE